mmetsp:Transcript_105837/g.299388  ORF Transcript_105837/g.299388 Transcript_105837/m.299388 type:complete len:235 (-) Transcript_105837:425-1129(-)
MANGMVNDRPTVATVELVKSTAFAQRYWLRTLSNTPLKMRSAKMRAVRLPWILSRCPYATGSRPKKIVQPSAPKKTAMGTSFLIHLRMMVVYTEYRTAETRQNWSPLMSSALKRRVALRSPRVTTLPSTQQSRPHTLMPSTFSPRKTTLSRYVHAHVLADIIVEDVTVVIDTPKPYVHCARNQTGAMAAPSVAARRTSMASPCRLPPPLASPSGAPAARQPPARPMTKRGRSSM